MKTTTKQSAAEAYADAQITGRALLAEIERLLDAHQDARDPDEVTWPAVGDLRHANQLLGEIRDFLARGSR